MSFTIDQYVKHVEPTSGECINTEYPEKWTGYMFKVRNGLEKYNSIEEWENDIPQITEYVYRIFQRGSPDIIRRDFMNWFGGECEIGRASCRERV